MDTQLRAEHEVRAFCAELLPYGRSKEVDQFRVKSCAHRQKRRHLCRAAGLSGLEQAVAKSLGAVVESKGWDAHTHIRCHCADVRKHRVIAMKHVKFFGEIHGLK